MSILFFGAPRPATVVSARIEMKIPVGPEKAAGGRPLKVWTGSSDADEAQAYVSICDSKILSKVLNERKLLQDGTANLTGILYFIDGLQTVHRHEFEFTYFAVNLDDKPDSLIAFATKCLEIYAEQMAGMRGDHKEFMKSNADAFGKLAEAFSDGLGKVSKHNKGLNRITKKLERDRAQLTAALLTVSGERRPGASSSEPSKLLTGLEAIKLLVSIREKSGSGNGNI